MGEDFVIILKGKRSLRKKASVEDLPKRVHYQNKDKKGASRQQQIARIKAPGSLPQVDPPGDLGCWSDGVME
jgi:hypothetical protein